MQSKMYPLEEALKAQQALRKAGSLGEELFPVQAFVGMISDEIEALRSRGLGDHDIASLITENSSLDISAEEIAENYAAPNERRRH